MEKRIDKNSSIFSSSDFQKDKYKFYIALKIINDSNSIIYSDEKDYIIMQMSENLPIWIWTKDGIDSIKIKEILNTIDTFFHKTSKITCKKEFYDLLIGQKIRVDSKNIFEMGTLHCEKIIQPQNIVGKMHKAEMNDLDILSKYWYDDFCETEKEEYSPEQAREDIAKLIQEGNFYILKDDANKIVSMARFAVIDNIASINKVYTPVEERKKGYCANLIYSISKMLLNNNVIPMLYTDYNYIPSNRSYMNVGYMKDGILVSFYLKDEK